MTIVYGINVATSERTSGMLTDFFVNERDALRTAKGAGWYGGDGTVVSCRLYDSLDEYTDQKRAEERAAALNKLTDKERQILGLHP